MSSGSVYFFIGLLCLSLASAQITFTREWVTGKRAVPVGGERVDSDVHVGCVSLKPAIDFLLQVESMHRSGARAEGLLNSKKPYDIVNPLVFGKHRPDGYSQPTADDINHPAEHSR